MFWPVYSYALLQPPPSSTLSPPCLPSSFHNRTGTLRATNTHLSHTWTTSDQKLFHQQWVLRIDQWYSPQGAVVFPSLAPTTSSPCFQPPFLHHLLLFILLYPPPPPLPTPAPLSPFQHAHTRGRNWPLWPSFPDGFLFLFLLWDCHGNQLRGWPQQLNHSASYLVIKLETYS